MVIIIGVRGTQDKNKLEVGKMKTYNIENTVVNVPEEKDIDTLAIGDMVLNVFGWARVKEIKYRGIDINSKKYVGFYSEFGSHNGILSGSYKEDEPIMTLRVSQQLKTSYNVEQLISKMQ